MIVEVYIIKQQLCCYFHCNYFFFLNFKETSNSKTQQQSKNTFLSYFDHCSFNFQSKLNRKHRVYQQNAFNQRRPFQLYETDFKCLKFYESSYQIHDNIQIYNNQILNIKMTERRPWTQEQDKTLKHLKQTMNIKKWSQIARLMESNYKFLGRNGKQCRQRYHNHLDNSIILRDFTLEEEQLLFKIHDQIGNRWSILARQFSGRTDNFLKNYFHSRLRKAIRKLNKQIKEKIKKTVKPYKLTIIYKIVQASDYKFCSNINLSFDQVNFFSQLKNQLLFYAGGKTSQTHFEGMKELDIAYYLINQLELFQKSYLRKAGKNQKKMRSAKAQLKTCCQKNKNNSTSNSQCKSDSEYQSFQYLRNIKFDVDTFKINQEQNSQKEDVKAEEGFIQKAHQQDDQGQVLTNDFQMQSLAANEKNFYSFVIQKSQITMQNKGLQNNGMEHLIQQDSLSFLSFRNKITFSESESMKMIDYSYQNNQESQIWLRRLDSYSNIDQALFE